MQRAVVARDIGCRDVVEQVNDRDRTIREASAAAGGSLMTPSELNDRDSDLMLDFNRTNVSASQISIAINALLEQAVAQKTEVPRRYLGASSRSGLSAYVEFNLIGSASPHMRGARGISLPAVISSRN